jgi:aspartyl-tRNA synthetase
MSSAIGSLFREYLSSQDFIEIHSPKLIGGVSEGGTEVFKLNYFG